jgi:hypothetical protein
MGGIFSQGRGRVRERAAGGAGGLLGHGTQAGLGFTGGGARRRKLERINGRPVLMATTWRHLSATAAGPWCAVPALSSPDKAE